MKASTALNAAAHAVSAVALTFGMASNANALDIGCYKAGEQVAQLKNQMANLDYMGPAIDFHQSTDNPSKPSQMYLVMNKETRKGHRISKSEDGSMCVLSNISNVQTLDTTNKTPDPRAYMSAPKANAENTGINRVIHGVAYTQNQLPLLKADETIPQLKLTTIMYLLANPNTGGGQIVVASREGDYLPKYTKDIPAKTDVNKGIVITDFGKEIFSEQLGRIGNSAIVAQREP